MRPSFVGIGTGLLLASVLLLVQALWVVSGCDPRQLACQIVIELYFDVAVVGLAGFLVLLTGLIMEPSTD